MSEGRVIAIRKSDAALMYATPRTIELSQGELMQFHGNFMAEEFERRLYVAGITKIAGTGAVIEEHDAGRLDLSRMTRADLLEFASDKYGLKFGRKTPTEDIVKAIGERAGGARLVREAGASAGEKAVG